MEKVGSHNSGKVSARSARLRYVVDAAPGIWRRRAGRGFVYVTRQGKVVRNSHKIKRIRGLGIPPAWTNVWICADPRGHLQATGRDARGRKQYRYHPKWRAIRDGNKFDRLAAFGKALPDIRRRVNKDLTSAGLPSKKVAAAVVKLLGSTLFRIGNAQYARTNNSYGLTTLRDRHVRVIGSKLQMHFRGKGGKMHRTDIRDRRLAGILKRCQEIPGHELFQYFDDDHERQVLESTDVNNYLRDATGQDFTAKDFRTWAGTVHAARALSNVGPPTSQTEAKRKVAQAIRTVADILGNTPAVCRSCYVHPVVINAYLDGSLLTMRNGKHSLRRDERFVLRLLNKPAR